MILRDSIDATLIPRDSDAVAGYGDGVFIWSPSWKDGSNWWDLFPAATPRLVIVVHPGNLGDVADVENGDFAPSDAPGFVRSFSRPGRRAPSLYCNRATWPRVVAALEAAGLDPAAIDWWIATLDGTTDVWYGAVGVAPPAGLRVVAVQFRDTGAFDESEVLDPGWLGVSPPAPPLPSWRSDPMLEADFERGNGDRDVFAILPDGSGRAFHSWLGPDSSLRRNEALPGSWTGWLPLDLAGQGWRTDGSLHLLGRGLDGSVFDLAYTAAAGWTATAVSAAGS